jgi:hypothetical protein
MPLTEAQRLAREGKLTASRVAPLMTGDKAKIMAVWRELCGDPTYEEENLDEIWQVQLGLTTEKLNLDWYERKAGRALSKRGEVVSHPLYEWAAATLDGYDDGIPGPVEAKHVGGFETIDKVIERYQPQVQWQMEVTGSTKCILSVIEGGRVPRLVTIDRNPDYADELMARALRLMEHVWNMTEPVEVEPLELKTISRLKDYNMTGNNVWAAAAADWLKHKDAANSWNTAVETLKGLVANDAATCTGYGLVVKRDRANRLSIKPISARNDDLGSKSKLKH